MTEVGTRTKAWWGSLQNRAGELPGENWGLEGFSCIGKDFQGTSLVLQWLRLHAPNAGGLGSTPGQGTRSHMLQLRPCADKINKNK